MKCRNLLTLILLGLAPASVAQAENSIGAWRWLGMGWGPGYHSGARGHGHRHHQFSGQPTYPAWEESWPVNPEAAPGPMLEPTPEPGYDLNEENSVLPEGALPRSALKNSQPNEPHLHGYLESSRRSRILP